MREVTYPLWQWREGARVLPARAALERSQWLAPDELATLQLSRLRAIVESAYTHARFYREAFSRVGVRPADIRSLADLRHLPVLEKQDLRDQGAYLMTELPARHLVKRQTSGSTGIPVVVWVPPEARDAWTAATQRMMGWWQVGLGDRRLSLISRHSLTRARWLKQYGIANVLEYSAMNLSHDSLLFLSRLLARGTIRVLSGYPSSLEYMARYIELRRAEQPEGLKAVFNTGETLRADQRALMRRVFRCPIVDEYGSSETGHIAGECPYGRKHVAAENVLVESVPSGGLDGEPDLLVTDLLNYTMPLIRYRIGDLGVFGEPCPCGRELPVLCLQAGRVSELIVLPDGRRMDFSAFDAVVDEAAARGLPLHQFRVIQHAVDHFEILLAGPDRLAEGADWIRQRMLGTLRASVRMDVRVVAGLPPDPTGKRRRFISRLVLRPERPDVAEGTG